MSAPISKYIVRLKTIAGHSLMQFFPSLFNLVLSWVVIRYYHQDWWGIIVGLQLIQYFATNMADWGNKPFLLREFSRKPYQLYDLWRTSLITRSMLLAIILSVIFAFDYSFVVLLNLVLWILFRSVQQSFESVIIYQKRFFLIIWIELVSMLLLSGCLIIYQHILSFEYILWMISAIYFLKACTIIFIYYTEIFRHVKKWKPDISILKQSLPFMLLGLVALLQAKSDLLCIIFYLDKDQVASYQILMSFILLLLTLPSMIFTPFIKNIYRINDTAFRALHTKSILAGIVLTTAGLPAVYIVLEYFYKLHFDFLTYVFSYVYVLSTFFYFLYIYVLYKGEKQQMVMWGSFAAVVLNVAGCLLLIPMMGISGAMLANCISQIFSWIIYQRMSVKLLDSQKQIVT